MFKNRQHSIEIAKLRLALLKENFNFRDFYEKLTTDTYSICPELREPDENDEDYFSKVRDLELESIPLFGGYAEIFHVNEKFTSTVQERYGISTPDILNLFDPQKSIEDLSIQKLDGILSLLFFSAGVTEFGRAHGLTEDFTGKLSYSRYEPSVCIDVQRYERLLKIDLRKKKNQLLTEFETFLDHELSVQKTTIEIEAKLEQEDSPYRLQTAYQWEPDVSRNRINKAWKQLDVWKERREKKSFKEIAQKLNVAEDAAKKSFYRAYELIQGKPYDPDTLQKEIWLVKKSELQKTCDTCPNRNNCDTLCPEILKYINQDYTPQREKLLKDDSDSLKDYLSQK